MLPNWHIVFYYILYRAHFTLFNQLTQLCFWDPFILDGHLFFTFIHYFPLDIVKNIYEILRLYVRRYKLRELLSVFFLIIGLKELCVFSYMPTTNPKLFR